MLLMGQFTHEVIAGATEGSMTSKLVNGVQRTYIAYRDVAGNLAVRKYFGSTHTTKVVWTGVEPENVYVTVNPSGRAIVTFWSGFRFHYALETGTWTGNCGPAANWICDTVRLPANTGGQGVKRERVVGSVDPAGNLHFVYLLRKAGLAPAPSAEDSLYYVARSAGGVWQTPTNQMSGGKVLASPTQLESGSLWLHWVAVDLTHDSAIGAASGGQYPNLAYQQKTMMGGLTAPADFVAHYVDMDNRSAPLGSCVVYSYTDANSTAKKAIAYVHGDGWMTLWNNGYTPIREGALSPHAPKDFCNVAYTPGNVPAIAYTKANHTVALITAPNSSSFGLPWIYTAVDNTGTFERPVLVNGLGGKFWILYQGPGYLKLARQL